jgi:hypothetical protein
MSAGGSGLMGGGKSGVKSTIAKVGTSARKAGSTSITAQTTKMLNQLSRNAIAKSGSGTVSADLVNKLLEAITALLSTIADNTAPIEKIYKALVDYTDGNTTKTKASKKHEKGEKVSTNTSEVDENITTLVGVLAQLAKG